MKYIAVAGLSLALAACGGGSGNAVTVIPKAASRPVAAGPVPTAAAPRTAIKGLEAVIGKDANALTRMFGEPRLDAVEVYGRKLQFAGKACILDAYLYPDGRNGTEIVSHVDARRTDGAEVDRAACVNALQN